MTADADIDPDGAAFIRADIARTEAQRSIVADCAAILASLAPAALSQLRHAARHCQTGAELGAFEPHEFLDLVAFHTERATILEHACAAAGYPHKGADVLPWSGAASKSPTGRYGPGQVIRLIPRFERG